MKRWKPKVGEAYWTLHLHILVMPLKFTYFQGQAACFGDNCFRTKTQALHAAKLVRAALKQAHEEGK